MFLLSLGFNLCVKALLGLMLFTFVQSDEQLKLVQLMWRHGDRSPVYSYPTDPWKNAWTDGLGQLTSLGKQQHYLVGQFLSKTYGNFINHTYNHEEIYVRSTNIDRTLMSALSNLAGFLPPRGQQVWNEKLAWQPIPIHTIPVADDYLLTFEADCPKYYKLYGEALKSKEAKEIDDQNQDTYKFLSEKTGLKIEDFIQASELHDILVVQRSHNMSWPEWVTEKVFEQLIKFRVYFFVYLAKTREMARIVGGGGTLVGQVTTNMEAKINNPKDRHKMYIYSAHDTTLASFLIALNIFDPQAPPYRSVVMVELWKNNGQDLVKILYRNDTTRDPYVLTLKGCATLCPFATFKKLTSSIVPVNSKAECAISGSGV